MGTLISNNVGLNPFLQATPMHFISSVSSHSLNICFLPDFFSGSPLKVNILVKIWLHHTKSKKKKEKEKVQFFNQYILLYLLYFFGPINRKLISLGIDLIVWLGS